MAAKSGTRGNAPAEEHDWYLQEWMRREGVTQAALRQKTGWSKATASDIFHGRTPYRRQLVEDAAKALGIEPFELMIPPQLIGVVRAAIRRARLRGEESPDETGGTRTGKTRAPKKFGGAERES